MVRRFGRYRLLRLLGKSERTMAWLASTPAGGRQSMLVLPRQPPPDAAARERWRQATHAASRLAHPQLAAVAEAGVQDGWPFVTHEMPDCTTWLERSASQGLSGPEAGGLVTQLLHGLAFAHDAGIAHHDLQPYLLIIDGAGQLRLAGLAVAAELAARGQEPRQHTAQSPAALRTQREAAERDVLAAGVLLHGMLAGSSALDEPDSGRVIARLPPLGREIVRLPWTTPHVLAEPLRAIVNRATDRQPRQRYLNARTLQRALEGWLQTDAAAGGGPLALLSDRLRSAGVLPSSPGAAARAARLSLMERERTNELAELVLQDLALSFELLRLVNSAQVRGAQLAGSGPVLTVRRAIALLGLDGVRRSALALRGWPGPLGEEGAAELARLIDRCKRAGRAAMALRPAAYDAEVVYLVTLLQNLGRLVVHYHFADEAQQMRRLMQSAAPPCAGEPEDPGMSEEGASFAVLGAGIEAIGAEVARSWGLDESVLAMIRRLPTTTPVRSVDSDDDMLRTVASCANEAVDALGLPAPQMSTALQRVAQRYGRVLGIGVRELKDALEGSGAAAQQAGPEMAPMAGSWTTPPGPAAAPVMDPTR
jgi:non-specific serine/threonine protein kinase